MWSISATQTFKDWLGTLNSADRASVYASILMLRASGPMLSRPHADTIKGARFGNLKELRVQSRGEPIRAFFAFDPWRRGILLCAGNKVGNEKRFYKEMIPLAEREYANYLQEVDKKE